MIAALGAGVWITLTTVGYGDITPTSPLAHFLAMMEAVIGQFYLTVLVASLVGSVLSNRQQGGGPQAGHNHVGLPPYRLPGRGQRLIQAPAAPIGEQGLAPIQGVQGSDSAPASRPGSLEADGRLLIPIREVILMATDSSCCGLSGIQSPSRAARCPQSMSWSTRA